MQTISSFIEDFQSELNRQSLAFDGTWVKRRRIFNTRKMFVTILYMITQRSCNFKSLSSLISLNEAHLESRFSASSFSDARKKFSPYFFVDLSQWIYSYIDTALKKGKWFGRSIFAVDSTTITLPRELIDDGFGHEETGAFFPHATLTVLYDLRLGMVYDSIISQHKSERMNAMQLFKGVPEGGLVVGDRGFFSFELVHEALHNKIDVLFRISVAHAPEEIRELAETNFKDQIVSVTPSIPTERKLHNHGFSAEPIEVRVLRKKIAGKDYILITTVLEPTIKHRDFFKLYESRWDIEEYFKLIKAELKVESFKSKHLNGILQEIFATIFLTNLSEGITRLRFGPKTKTIVRAVVSALTVIRLVRDTLLSIMSASKKTRQRISNALATGIGRASSNFRPGRSYPRNFWREINPWTRYAKGTRR